MKMNSNKEKFDAFLKELKKLYKEGKTREDFDKIVAQELKIYTYMLEEKIFWENRQDYFSILNSFVNKEITSDKFLDQFCELRISNLHLLSAWRKKLDRGSCSMSDKLNEKDFLLNSNYREFSELISTIYNWVNICECDITLETNLENLDLIGYGISPELLRLLIKDDYLPKVYQYCKKS